MEEKFLFGVIIGMLGGALVATNSVKARQLLKDGQKTVKQSLGGKSKNKNAKTKAE